MSLLDMLRSRFSQSLLSQTSSILGEGEDKIAKALSGIGPVVLYGIANKIHDSSAMNSIYQMITDAGQKATQFTGFETLSAATAFSATSSPIMDVGKQMSASIFGNNTPAIINIISNFAGIKSGTASTLLNFATPFIMGVLGRHVNEKSLNSAAFTNLFKSEKSSFGEALPPGISKVLATEQDSGSELYKTERKKTGRFLPVLFLLLAIGVLFYLIRSYRQQSVYTIATVDTSLSISNLFATPSDFFKRTLPNNTELNIPKLGVENKLLDFIEDENKIIDNMTWFSFDRLVFEPGSAILKQESNEQLNNIAEILKTFSAVHLKIGGYTDVTGDEKNNIKLSDDRAMSVRDELIKLGIAANRLKAEGYGSKHPVADNNTEEGRARNRRIDLNVTAK